MDFAVQIEGLTKRFGTTVAVNDATFSVPAGSVFALIGPNGAGKTTTFGILCGYLHPDSGRATVLGCRAGDVGSLKRRMGTLPQDAALPPNDRVGEALTFYARLMGLPKAKAKAESEAALARVGLAEWWKVRAGALSHGMAKRVGLAQAFLGSPELVFLDEPTAGLDPKSAFQVREVISQMRGQRTVVISSHNLQELEEMCDRAAILDHGRVVVAGSMGEITASVGEVRFQIASEQAPLDAITALPCVSQATFDAARKTLFVSFAPGKHEAEDVIGEVLRTLLDRKVKISGVAKGRKLEERVMQLT
jgi:ABC-2 type transport system ATP-binding protein